VYNPVKFYKVKATVNIDDGYVVAESPNKHSRTFREAVDWVHDALHRNVHGPGNWKTPWARELGYGKSPILEDAQEDAGEDDGGEVAEDA